MRYFLIMLFALLVTALPYTGMARSMSESIVAVVNEDIVTSTDVEDRLKLIMVSSGFPDTEETRGKLRPQIVNTLIDEQIRLQEAERLEITITQDEIDTAFSTLSQQNNMSADQFRGALRQSNIPIETLYDQIRAQIAWTKVVQTRLRPQIDVTDNDVDFKMDQIAQLMGQQEFLVSEIYLPIEDPKEKGKVGQTARNLVTQIRERKAPFFQVAQQFSKAAGAAKGGDLGWVQQGQLPEELDSALKNLEPGQITNPVETLTGYHILLLRQKRSINEQTVPSREQMTEQIGMQRLDLRQRRYFMDLKAAAFIENRAS